MLRRGVILQTRYRIRHELGQGTFGTVYSVHDGFSGDYVAMKLVKKNDEEELESGLTEVKVLREIGCIPGVPRCLHHFETASHLAIVTRQELATLDFLYKNNRPPWFQPKTIVAIGWNLVSILEAVHNKK
uniref:Protein kinase domain-containing protein n=1 Tax=Caenorhabditis tropicalis TaxID=1561998 RepID=A0A1I7V3W6_9PELO